MDKFNVFFLVVMALVAATSSAPSTGIIRSSDTPRFSEVLIGSAQNSQVPVQPVEETAEEEGEEAVVVAAPEGSGAVIEERETPVVVPEPDLCADVSGVWQSQSSEARLVLAEDDERDLDGLYRNDSESGWYKLRGHRGSHEGAAFAFSVIWQEGNAASSVVGHCHSCTDDAPTLEMHSVHSFRTPECGSRVVTILDKSYNKVADAAEARLLLKDMLGDDSEEEAGEPAAEEAETQEAQAEESSVEVINVEIKETETGSGDA